MKHFEIGFHARGHLKVRSTTVQNVKLGNGLTFSVNLKLESEIKLEKKFALNHDILIRRWNDSYY